MQLTEVDMTNKFAVIMTADWNDADYVTKFSTFDNKRFNEISEFITMIQDLYDNRETIQEWLKQKHGHRLDIRDNLNLYIREYFKHHLGIDVFEISEDAIDWITDELYDFLPATNDIEYPYPHTICSVKIIKDSKIFEVEKPNDAEVKQAIDFISDWLRESEIYIKQSIKYIINWLKNLT